MPLDSTSRTFLRMAVALILVGVVAAVWEVLASQAPDSPFQVGVLPGPVGALRETALIVGLSLLGAAWWIPVVFPSGLRRLWTLVASVGAILMVGAAAYGATTGMHGVQIDDPRLDSQLLLTVRVAGFLLLLAWLVRFSVGVFRRE